MVPSVAVLLSGVRVGGVAGDGGGVGDEAWGSAGRDGGNDGDRGTASGGVVPREQEMMPAANPKAGCFACLWQEHPLPGNEV